MFHEHEPELETARDGLVTMTALLAAGRAAWTELAIPTWAPTLLPQLLGLRREIDALIGLARLAERKDPHDGPTH